MSRLAWPCFAVCVAVAAAYLVATTGQLPAQVASHFGAGNAPNGWMTRDGYLRFMLAFGIGLPAVVAGAIAFLPRLWPNAINIPNREYWLTPARRKETIDALSAHGAWFGCLLSLFLAGIHHVVVEANRATPAALPAGLFFTLLAAFGLALVVWIGSLARHFRRRD